MEKHELIALINEHKNLKNSIAFLESEYGEVNFHIKSFLRKELENCQNQIKLLETSKLNNTERMCF